MSNIVLTAQFIWIWLAIIFGLPIPPFCVDSFSIVEFSSSRFVISSHDTLQFNMQNKQSKMKLMNQCNGEWQCKIQLFDDTLFREERIFSDNDFVISITN